MPLFFKVREKYSSDTRVPITADAPYQPTDRLFCRCSAGLLGSELHEGFSHQRALRRRPVFSVCKYPATLLRQSMLVIRIMRLHDIMRAPEKNVNSCLGSGQREVCKAAVSIRRLNTLFEQSLPSFTRKRSLPPASSSSAFEPVVQA